MAEKCVMCGRKLTNPISVARGIGPVCGGRGYFDRIVSRFGASFGVVGVREFMKINKLGVGCKHFRNIHLDVKLNSFGVYVLEPSKYTPKTYVLKLKRAYALNEVPSFPSFCGASVWSSSSIPGFCVKKKVWCDGNVFSTCSEYEPRADLEEITTVFVKTKEGSLLKWTVNED